MSQNSPPYSRLIFAWSAKHRFILYGMLLVALLIHIGALSLFRVVSPPRQPAPISSAHISLLDSNFPNAASLSQWLKGHDPTLFIQTQVPAHLTLPPVRYVPSYEREHPTLAGLPKPFSKVAIPSGPIPIPRSWHSRTLQKSPPSLPPPREDIHIELKGDIAGRHIQSSPPADILTSLTPPRQPCTFLTAVSSEGKFRYIFLLRSSGNSKFDQWAMNHLRQVQLDPMITKKMTWGTVTYL